MKKILASAIAIVISVPSFAVTYSSNFDAGYNVGSLSNQQSWFSDSIFGISQDRALSGNQSVKISNPGTQTGSAATAPISPFSTGAVVSESVYIPTNTAESDKFAFGLQVFADDGTFTGPNQLMQVFFSKAGGIYGTTNQNGSTSLLGNIGAAAGAANRWLSVSLSVASLSSGSTVSATVDGQTFNLATVKAGLTEISEIDILRTSLSGLPAGAKETAYVDNFAVGNPVPEPMTLVALGLGASALIAKKRRK